MFIGWDFGQTALFTLLKSLWSHAGAPSAEDYLAVLVSAHYLLFCEPTAYNIHSHKYANWQNRCTHIGFSEEKLTHGKPCNG